MHTYILIRGIKKDADRWVEDMSMKFLPFTYNNMPHMVQLSMRPIWLYECVYPEPAHELFMKLIQPNVEEVDGGYYSAATAYLWALRKLMKLNKTIIPEGLKIDTSQSFYRPNLGIHIIGSKPDEKQIIEVVNEKL